MMNILITTLFVIVASSFAAIAINLTKMTAYLDLVDERLWEIKEELKESNQRLERKQ